MKFRGILFMSLCQNIYLNYNLFSSHTNIIYKDIVCASVFVTIIGLFVALCINDKENSKLAKKKYSRLRVLDSGHWH